MPREKEILLVVVILMSVEVSFVLSWSKRHDGQTSNFQLQNEVCFGLRYYLFYGKILV